jgi:hypothetical protein
LGDPVLSNLAINVLQETTKVAEDVIPELRKRAITAKPSEQEDALRTLGLMEREFGRVIESLQRVAQVEDERIAEDAGVLLVRIRSLDFKLPESAVEDHER